MSTKNIIIRFITCRVSSSNNVILVDPWWNPALEDQAFDRAHRFGQERTVNIHKLSVPDSVEQRILEVRLLLRLRVIVPNDFVAFGTR